MKGQYFYDNMSSELKIKWMAEWRAQSTGANLDRVMNSDYRSFKHFILHSFVWGNTSQGHAFWRHISDGNFS